MICAGVRPKGMEFITDLVRRSEDSLAKVPESGK
jgi:hypothetical protein